MAQENKNLTIRCKGEEYIADSEYFLDEALSLEDTGTSLHNPRLNFIICNFEHFEIKRDKPQKHHTVNTEELLYSLAHEMGKCNLSAEDEEYLEQIIGNDPMCMF